MNRASIVVDSSALVALLKLDDADHLKAIQIMDEYIVAQSLLVLLPLEVLSETINILGKKEGKPAAIAAGTALLAREVSGEIVFINSTVQTVGTALRLQTNASGSPSFTDCLVMTCAKERQTPYIFGFDATFQKNGYQLPPAQL